MPKSEVHICECSHCQQDSAHADQELHREMNLFLSRLDEQQRRCYFAVELERTGAGGDRLLFQITRLDEKTIQRGRRELAASKHMKQLNIEFAEVCSRWNYTLRPRAHISPERDLEPEVIF